MLFDICIATLLFLATASCWVLARKMYRFKEVTTTLTPSINQVSGYVNQVSKQMETFKNISDQQKQFFTHSMPKAQALQDDLQTLLEHCEKIATRLDHIIDQATGVEKNLGDMMGSASIRHVGSSPSLYGSKKPQPHASPISQASPPPPIFTPCHHQPTSPN